ncbi:MAG: permease-like cell division protein FtsX [Bacteroidota bacterium]
MENKEDKTTKRRLTSSFITSVMSMSLVLFMAGLLGLIVLHSRRLSDYVKENIGFSVVINENVKEAEVIQLKKLLDAAPYVKTTEYITKEKAAQDFSKELGEDFIKFIGYNPLLPSIDLRLKAEYANNASMESIEKDLLRNTIVKEVNYQKSLVDLVNQNVNRISLFILGFSLLLLFIAVALINNTIRLSVFSKRFLIRSMQLVGATQHFIRKPFILRGLSNGLISTIIALLLLGGVVYFANNQIPELVGLQDIDMYLMLTGFVLVMGFLLSFLSTYFAVRKYLRIKTDYLYYY